MVFLFGTATGLMLAGYGIMYILHKYGRVQDDINENDH